MNIWILNHYAITPDLPGGTRHFDFAKELINRGYNVTIFASDFIYGISEYRKIKRNEKWIIEDYDGVKFIWVKTIPYKGNGIKRVLNMLSYSLAVERIGKFMYKNERYEIEKPDIIIGSSVHPFAGLTAYRLSRFFNVPFIFEVRDLWPQTLIDLGNISSIHPFVIILRKLEKFLYEKSDKIIVLLPKASEYICSLSINRDKIIWIPNGVDLKRFEFSSKYLKKNNKFIVLYAGAHGIADGLDTLLDSAEILKKKHYDNIIFRLIGDGLEREGLLKKAKQKKLNNVFFEKPVIKNRIPMILNSADILFVGSLAKKLYKYGLSFNKLFDYLASGKSIIFSTDAINNPIAEAKAGLTVPPEDPRAVADAIIKLYNMSKAEREQMGRNGRKYVEKYHSIPVLVDKLEEVFKILK